MCRYLCIFISFYPPLLFSTCWVLLSLMLPGSLCQSIKNMDKRSEAPLSTLRHSHEMMLEDGGDISSVENRSSLSWFGCERLSWLFWLMWQSPREHHPPAPLQHQQAEAAVGNSSECSSSIQNQAKPSQNVTPLCSRAPWLGWKELGSRWWRSPRAGKKGESVF